MFIPVKTVWLFSLITKKQPIFQALLYYINSQWAIYKQFCALVNKRIVLQW